MVPRKTRVIFGIILFLISINLVITIKQTNQEWSKVGDSIAYSDYSICGKVRGQNQRLQFGVI